MKLASNVEALELTMQLGANQSVIHPVLLWDAQDGVTLVDTGTPGLLPAIEANFARLGLKFSELKRLIITHQDIDHIGSAPDVVAATGATVMAHADDVPYIEGAERLIKLDPARFESLIATLPPPRADAVRAMLASPPKVKVNRRLRDGEELPWHGGIVVIHTPGHTPGHLCLYLKAHRLLISGDALRVEEGKLVGPSPTATPDMPRAIASLAKLAPYAIDRVLCYHGGLSPEGASSRIRELAGA